MKLSKFILLFVIGCAVFQFATNSLLSSEVKLFPHNTTVYPGMESATGWKKVTAIVIYPIKLVLIGPLSGLTTLPDPPPPFIFLAFALYWAAIAAVTYFLIYKLTSKRNKTA